MEVINVQGRPPILLIFGLPRSGTTWLGKIFDSHPETLYRHEPDNYPRLEALPRFPSLDDTGTHANFVRQFVAELPRRNDTLTAGKLPIFHKEWRGQIRHRLLQASTMAAKLGDRANLNLPVLGARGDRIHPPPMIVWKSIESVARLGLLIEALPQARGIQLIRHPCGQINSVLRGEREGAFRDNSPTSEYYDAFKKLLETPQARRRGLTLADLQHMRPVERLAWRWVLTNEKAVEDTEKSGRVQVICYETLCADSIGTTRGLFSFAGLNWNDQTARFVAQSVNGDAASYYSVYKNPTHSVSRWHDEMSADNAARIEAVLQNSSLSRLYEESGAQSASIVGS